MDINSRRLAERDYLRIHLPLLKMQRVPGRAVRYRMGFRLSMLNDSQTSVRLVGRKWHITDEDGTVRMIEAEGVFNEHPVLPPKAVFSYSGMQEFTGLPKKVELRFFGTDQQNRTFITPPLTFPAPGARPRSHR